MRLKRQYTVIIVVIMVALTAVVGSMVVNSARGTRIAYLAVSADKESFDLGENITFKLKPLSQDIEFSLNGLPGYYGAGVNILRIPDSTDLDELISDTNEMRNLRMWGGGDHSIIIPFPTVTSTGEPVSLSWNGSLPAYNDGLGKFVWGKASAGHYLLYPTYYYGAGTSVKFMLDRSSIFYYNSLKVDFNVTASASTTIKVGMTLPIGSDATEGNLTSFVPNYASSNRSEYFHNFTIDLDPGTVTQISVTYALQDFDMARMTAVLRTSDNIFVFGMSIIDLGEEGDLLVQY